MRLRKMSHIYKQIWNCFVNTKAKARVFLCNKKNKTHTKEQIVFESLYVH